ncbi:MAG: tetratricopeptide repeat protein [Planctomycetota bacterium]
MELEDDAAGSIQNRGKAREGLNQFEEALADYDRALALDDTLVDAHIGRGRLLRAKGEFKDAIRAYDRAIELDDRNVGTLVARASTWSKSGNTDAALKDCRRALDIQPDCFIALVNHAYYLVELGHPEQARRSADDALAIDKERVAEQAKGGGYDASYVTASAHWNRAYALLALGEFAKADTDRGRAAELHRGYDAVDAHMHWAAALNNTGRFAEALAAVERAEKLGVDDPHYVRGYAFAGLGRSRKALESYERSLAIRPGRWPTLFGKAVALNNLRRYPEALGAAAEVRRKLGDSPHVSYVQGYALARMDEDAKALAAFNRAPRHEGALIEKARVLAIASDPALRDAAQAVAIARSLRKTARNNWGVQMALGIALCASEEFAAALKSLKLCAEESGNEEAWFFIAIAKHKLGHKDAREYYDRAVAWVNENHPEDKQLNRFRAEAEKVLGIKSD